MYRWDYRRRRHHGWGWIVGLFLLAALFWGGFKVIGLLLLPLFLIIPAIVIFGVMRFAFAAMSCEQGSQRGDWWHYADQYSWKRKRKNDEYAQEEDDSLHEKRKNDDVFYI